MSVRLDKWLWAARLFKTRAKAKEAIDGGKVHLNGSRAKPGKEVSIDDSIKVTQGFDEKMVVVRGLADKRRSAAIAQTLYLETPESIKKRALHADQRRAEGKHIITEGRPSKRDRRLIHQFKDQNLD